MPLAGSHVNQDASVSLALYFGWAFVKNRKRLQSLRKECSVKPAGEMKVMSLRIDKSSIVKSYADYSVIITGIVGLLVQ